MEGIAQALHARQDLKGGPPERHVEGLIQWGVPGKERSVEGIAQDLKGEPPYRHVEVLIQWGIPGKDSSVEGIAQDLKVEPPKRHVSVHTLSAGREGAREGQEEAAEGGPPGGAVGLLSVLPSSSLCLSHSMSWEASREVHRTADPGLYLEGDQHWGKSDDYIKQH